MVATNKNNTELFLQTKRKHLK